VASEVLTGVREKRIRGNDITSTSALVLGGTVADWFSGGRQKVTCFEVPKAFPESLVEGMWVLEYIFGDARHLNSLCVHVLLQNHQKTNRFTGTPPGSPENQPVAGAH